MREHENTVPSGYFTTCTSTHEWGQYAGVHLPTRASQQWQHTKTQVLRAGPGESRKSEKQKSGLHKDNWLAKRMGNYMKDWRGLCPALPPNCPALSTSPQTTGFFLRIPLPQSKRQKPIYNKHSSRTELNGLTHFLSSLRLILQKDDFKEMHR